MDMDECFGNKYILNGRLEDAHSFDNSLVYEGDSIYEVIRMINNSPVFFMDHMERLVSGVRNRNKTMPADVANLKRNIIRLSEADPQNEVNLKIVFNYNRDSVNYLLYYVKPVYPSEKQHREGVRGILCYAERKNPGLKVINHKLRSSIFHKLILEEAHEALLVNVKGQITEGSRSNIFFIRKNTLVTAPGHMVLSGITRKQILGICHTVNIPVELRCVEADRISDYEAVFMTGTSPVVLPFSQIDGTLFNTMVPVMEELRILYMERAKESIRQFRF